MPTGNAQAANELYREPLERILECGFTQLPRGIDVADLNRVAQGMRPAQDGEYGEFSDWLARRIKVPKDDSTNTSRPYFDTPYAAIIWDFLNGNILLGTAAKDTEALYIRDTDLGGVQDRDDTHWKPRTLNTWHVLDLANEYHIPPAKWNPAWREQLVYECRQLTLRVIHGIKFNNVVFMREGFDPDLIRANGNHVPKNSKVIKLGPDSGKFYWPYELTIAEDYSPELSRQARKYIEFVTAQDGASMTDGAVGGASHSADNLTRFFATPLLESYKHLSYVLYGGGGNGKGILMNAFAMTPGLEHGMCASVDSQKLLGGQKGSGGFATDNEALKLKTALWAYDEEAADITLPQMTALKKISTGDPISARAIQQNSVDIYPKAVFAICTNNPVITTMTSASSRRFVFVRMRDGRKPDEFNDMLAFRDRYGAAAFIMASCDLWLADTGRDGKDFWDDVTIGSVDDLSPAEEWLVDQIVRYGYAVSSRNPYREDAQEHKNTLAKLGLKSTTKRLPVDEGKPDGNGSATKTMRVLVVADDVRFSPYREAIADQWEEAGAKTMPVEPRTVASGRVNESHGDRDELPDKLPSLKELAASIPQDRETPVVAVSDSADSGTPGAIPEPMPTPPEPERLAETVNGDEPLDEAYLAALEASEPDEPDPGEPATPEPASIDEYPYAPDSAIAEPGC